MKNYFVYRLKKCLTPFFVIMFAGVLVYALPIALGDKSYYYYVNYNLGYLMAVLGVFCGVMPIWLFSYKMDKRSTDLFYSLPVSRTKQFAVHYITGFITIIAAYTAAYLLGFIFIAIKFSENIFLIYYLPLYFAAIIPAYIIYSIAVFAFTRANSTFDGIMFIVFSMLAVFMAVLFISIFTSYEHVYYYDVLGDNDVYETYYYTRTENYISYGMFFPFTMLDQVTATFQDLICGYGLGRTDLTAGGTESVNVIVSFVLFTVASIAATAASFITERGCKAENCNQVSDSVFGYKTMLPLFLLVICSIFSKYWLDDIDTLIIYLIILAAVYALSVVYKKSFKIGWKYAVVLLCAAVIGSVCSFLAPGIF